MVGRSPKPPLLPELIIVMPVGTAGLVWSVKSLTGWPYKRLAVSRSADQVGAGFF